MANPHFIGLIQSLLSTAQAALGEADSPLVSRMARDGVLARRSAQRSLELLEMLAQKTAGNLDETERDVLNRALQTVRAGMERFSEPPDAEAARLSN